LIDVEVPAAVEEAARRRSEARSERDWATADRLRDEIEAAGWRVVDSGVDYRLEPASPPSVEVGGEIRYGSSDAVPSRLDAPPTGLATVVLLASPDADENRRSLAGLAEAADTGIDVVVVADGLHHDAAADLESPIELELVRTSSLLGRAAAMNIGIRRSRAPIVVVLDPSIVPTGDVITPLVEALADPSVAVAGPFGFVSTDLRRFEEVIASDHPSNAAAIQGYLMAFRRADAAARGPVDEAFRFYRNLDIWWSLVLRDEGVDRKPRRAVVVPGLSLERGAPAASRSMPAAARDRLSKRNFYRVLDRFRAREDLAVPPPG
jgi:GT2 family glycosyltransferase